MFYDFILTVPAATTKAIPAEETLKLTHGIIHRVEIEFPAGCVGLVSCIILHWEHQLYPLNTQGYFSADDHVIAFDDYFQLFYAPYTLKVRGWAPNTAYQHKIRIRIGLLPRSIAEYRFGKLTKVEAERIRAELEAALIIPEVLQSGG